MSTVANADVNALSLLDELRSLSLLLEEKSARAFRELAARPTVTSHLDQARDHLEHLCRNYAHAQAMLEFNARHAPAMR